MENHLAKSLQEAAGSMGITLTDREITMFSIYYQELLSWNKTFNLVSVKSTLDIPIKHFIDSLTPLFLISNTRTSLLDIGSGAGFPGLPMKIVRPSLEIFLLESSRKKTSFLKHIIRTLNLQDITVLHNRVELLMQNDAYKERFNIVISRAAFKLPDLLRQGSFFLATGGCVVAMKGRNVENELKDVSAMADFSLIFCHDIPLPILGDLRKILVFKKEALCS
jgi:16S rRNA (guanine527-N7)-methyltransferase